MPLRTILPQDFYVEMVCEGDLIGAYVIMHDCDGRGMCGVAIHVSGGHYSPIVVKCDNPQCNKTGEIQQ